MCFRYFTLLKYMPDGTSESAKKSKILMGACKNGNPLFSKCVADKIVLLKKEDYFKDSTLIPTPRSSLMVTGGTYPSKIIADELFAKGIGNAVCDCLQRISSIPKSSNNRSAQTRNTVLIQKNSLRVKPVMITTPIIILIDDVLTLGRTGMACALLLKDAYPDKEIKIFCPFRTRSMGNVDESFFIDIKEGVMCLSANGEGVRLPD